jgi:hypothetical protein
MSSTNACGSSKRVPGSRPATLRNSLSPCTRPSIHLATLPDLVACLRSPLWPRQSLLHEEGPGVKRTMTVFYGLRARGLDG